MRRYTRDPRLQGIAKQASNCLTQRARSCLFRTMGGLCSSLNVVGRRREFQRLRDQHMDIMRKLKLTHDEFAGMVKQFNHLARTLHDTRGRSRCFRRECQRSGVNAFAYVVVSCDVCL